MREYSLCTNKNAKKMNLIQFARVFMMRESIMRESTVVVHSVVSNEGRLLLVRVVHVDCLTYLMLERCYACSATSLNSLPSLL